jgi:hypothetical protein
MLVSVIRRTDLHSDPLTQSPPCRITVTIGSRVAAVDEAPGTTKIAQASEAVNSAHLVHLYAATRPFVTLGRVAPPRLSSFAPTSRKSKRCAEGLDNVAQVGVR